jgi:hypothetical protein
MPAVFSEQCIRQNRFGARATHEAGVHTDQRPVNRGPVVATDLRARHSSFQPFPIVDAAGAGWVWTHQVPFLDARLGLRSPGGSPWGLDLVWEQYRMPFEEITREWRDFGAIREIDRGTRNEWQSSWSVRLSREWRP